jgi:hypothetical protein
MYELIRSIINDAYLTEEIEELAWKTRQIALLFGGLFFAINWVWSVAVKLGKFDLQKWWSPDQLVRCTVLYVFLAWYPQVMLIPSTIINLVVKAVSIDESEYRVAAEAYAKMEEAYLDPDNPGYKDNLDEEGKETIAIEPEDNDRSFWSVIRSGNIGMLLLNAVAFVIAQIISVVIQALAVILGKVLYVIGPLTIVFSMLPFFKDRLPAWFTLWVNTQLVFVPLMILDSVFVGLFQVIAETPIVGMPSPVLLFNVVLIVLYMMAFWLTAKIAGNDAASKVLSTGVAAASALLGAGIAAGAGGLGAGGGKGLLDKVMSSGKGAAAGGSSSFFDKKGSEE